MLCPSALIEVMLQLPITLAHEIMSQKKYRIVILAALNLQFIVTSIRCSKEANERWLLCQIPRVHVLSTRAESGFVSDLDCSTQIIPRSIRAYWSKLSCWQKKHNLKSILSYISCKVADDDTVLTFVSDCRLCEYILHINTIFNSLSKHSCVGCWGTDL